VIFGPNPCQWWEPVFRKNYFYFLKIIKFFQIFFAFVLCWSGPKWFLGPTPAHSDRFVIKNGIKSYYL
jgi:hypothetical protein